METELALDIVALEDFGEILEMNLRNGRLLAIIHKAIAPIQYLLLMFRFPSEVYLRSS